jgi:Cof subfamily protein (haloacid dehalogenase superfamily)
MTIRLIAIDLDGTTLRPDGSISSRTVAALRRAMETGATVAIATGRLHSSAATFARRIGAHGPIISSNGALVRDLAGRTLLHRPLPPALPPLVIDLARRTRAQLELFAGDTLYMTDPDAKRAEFRRRLAQARPVEARLALRTTLLSYRIRGLHQLARDGAVPEKLFAGGLDEAGKAALAATLQSGVSDPLEITSSDKDNIEMTAAGVTKGSAVAWLASSLGLPLSEVMVIGDSLNDLSMFELDCVRVAMGNATQAIKERATHHTASHMEDGVAGAVERLVLKEAIA